MRVEDTALVNTILGELRDKCSTAVRPVKLQKLLFIVAGLHYATHNDWLLEYDFEAWRYGPVYRPAYEAFSAYGGSPIRVFAKDPNGESLVYTPDSSEFETVQDVASTYGITMTDFDLVELLHHKGTPWHAAYRKGRKEVIPRETVRVYYEDIIAQSICL